MPPQMRTLIHGCTLRPTDLTSSHDHSRGRNESTVSRIRTLGTRVTRTASLCLLAFYLNLNLKPGPQRQTWGLSGMFFPVWPHSIHCLSSISPLLFCWHICMGVQPRGEVQRLSPARERHPLFAEGYLHHHHLATSGNGEGRFIVGRSRRNREGREWQMKATGRGTKERR